MPIQHLTDEQVRSWSREQKDQWWLANVFRGDMPQLTLRAAITGFLLGGLLSATNLYIGAKTGWTLGVGLTSVILAFASFKVLSAIRLGRDFTILENNAMQSVATSAGYMTGPLISGIAAYMMVKDQVIPWWQMMLFNVALSILGVLVAFPMKRRFINDEQQPFPEGRACGVLLDTLYSSAASVGLFKAKALALAALFAGGIKFMTGESYHTWIQARILGLKTVRYLAENPIEKLFEYAGAAFPAIQGIDMRRLDLNPSINLEMFGAGGLMNIRYAVNMFAGMVLTWAVVVPVMVNRGDTISSKGETFAAPAVVALGKPFRVSTRDFNPPATLAVGRGLILKEGADPVPVTSVLTVEKDRIVDSQGRELKAPINVIAGELRLVDAKPIPLKKTKIGPNHPLKVEGQPVPLPATVFVKTGEDRDRVPIRAEILATDRGLAYADGRSIDGNLRLDAGVVTGPDGVPHAYESTFNRAALLNAWALWPGIAMLVCASMVSLFAKPEIFVKAFSGLFARRDRPQGKDVLRHIELPLWVSFVGIPLVGAVGVYMAHEWFGVKWLFGALAIPLIAVLSIIAAQATALTSITPTGSLSKITQFTFGALDKAQAAKAGIAANPAVNLMTACMTTEVASNAANLLMDIKPGYMLGAKPRQQAVGHCIGIVSGALASTPLFYMLFLAGHKDNPFTAPKEALADLRVEDVLLAQPDKFSFISAVQWKGISDLITQGLSKLPESALWAMGLTAFFGIVFEVWRFASKNRVPISPLAIGLGIVLPPDSTLWMFLGSLFFWTMGRLYAARKESLGHRLWIDTHEPICAGLIAGAALVGIGDILVKVFILE